jgi:hypothetical protein
MKPIHQTKFEAGNGNCLLACVASVLERPIASIPDFNLSGCGWFGEMYEWCTNEGIGLVLISPCDLESSLFYNLHAILLFSVPGFPDENHAIIGKCVRVASLQDEINDKWKWKCVEHFDPNPRGVTVGELQHMIVLIPNSQPSPPEQEKEL